jgi:hypothetical protein
LRESVLVKIHDVEYWSGNNTDLEKSCVLVLMPRKTLLRNLTPTASGDREPRLECEKANVDVDVETLPLQ